MVPKLKLLGLGFALSSIAALANPSDGCGTTSHWKFSKTDHYNHTLGTGRTFYVHRPAGYRIDTPHAVVLSFHGYSETERKQEMVTGLSKKGLTIGGKGIIAVYPKAAWGPGRHGRTEPAWMGAPYSITFIHDILESLNANLCVDMSRIYASGMSNGGGFTNILACDGSMTRRIAAFAPVAAALYAGTHPFDGCSPGRPVPIITFHGTADTQIPYKGERDGDLTTPDIEDWRRAWAVRNGCREDPTKITKPHDRTTKSEWDCGPGTVIGETVGGLKHSWPRKPITSFDATDDIVNFFEKHTL
ncbi:carbohydrate esterase family 1 protein [Mycena floridula]|nr:carbohydrate esterase family 1 protein [Mycena floridula]